MTAWLKTEGHQVNQKRVRRLLRKMGLEAQYPKPKTSGTQLEHRIYPYLLRNVVASYPNHVWGIDITYIRLLGGWSYLVAILDWYSRFVVSWELAKSLEMDFVLAAVERALEKAQPLICNSDQGSHFTAPQYIERLLAANIQISMDGKGRALDNIFTEQTHH